MARLSLAVLSFLALFPLFAAAPAQAADPAPAGKVRVLGLNVDGAKLTAKDRADLFAVLQSKLRLYPTIELKNPPEGEITDEMIDLECIDLDTSCLARLGVKYGADNVVHVEVTRKGKLEVLRVRLIEVDAAKLARDKQVEVKDVAGLAPALEAEVEAGFGAPPAPIVLGTLVVEADSPNAAIHLGERYLGTGTATVELEPGDYVIRLSELGKEEVIRKITVAPAQTTTEQVKMVVIPPVKPPIKKDKGGDSDSSWVVWAVVGAVVVGGAVAIIALTADTGDDTVRGPAVLGIDPTGAWRDPATLGGRP